MFLRKITKLKNIGKFSTAGVSGGEYEKYTLIYGGNGRGKSTLCAVLRSLQRGEANHIEVRKTFGSTTPAEATFLLDSGVAAYGAGKWNAPNPDIYIFDHHFIGENVHVGDQIAVDQRRNTYKIAVGEEGVRLTAEIDQLDRDISDKQTAITAQKKVIAAFVPKGLTLEAFQALAADAGIDAKVADACTNLKAAQGAASILARPAIVEVVCPEISAEFEACLSKGLEGVSADASQMVAEQARKHALGEHGAQWLSDGLKYLAEDSCAFCGQGISGLGLVEAYKAYFSEAYASLGNEISAMIVAIDSQCGEASGLKLLDAISRIRVEAAFWSPFLAAEVPATSLTLQDLLATLRLQALALAQSKAAQPLVTFGLTASFVSARSGWATIQGEVVEINRAVRDINARIAALKIKTAGLDVAKIEREILTLGATKARYDGPIATLFAAYSTLIADKDALVVTKDAKKTELDAYDAAVLDTYQREINGFLTQFGASFSLSKTTKNYVGGTPQSSYCIKFSGAEVDASETGKTGKPTFATTMSAGDKSTLALAFFLAQVKRDANLANKLLVFDDPFTSLDEFRREMTAKTIIRVGDLASQTLVFSHDKYFLDAVRAKIKNANVAAFQISTSAGNSSIAPWDIQREVKDGYLQSHMAVVEFVEGVTNDASGMRTALRPLLETYIRYRFPNKIPDGMWLGDMLGIIRADQDHPLTAVYQELDDINGYTAPFHHDAGLPFEPDEVMTFARRTIVIVGGT